LAGQRVVAVDSGPLGGEVAGDVADGAGRSDDLQVHDGLEDDGVGLVDRIEKGLAPGRDEGNFFRVHGMMLAIVDGDPDILQGKSREGTFREHLSYAVLHRGYELPRNRASHHVIHELEARAALQRLDAQEHFAELTGAAGLLLMPAVTFRG